jgi:CheY-like chemotaxis protein
MTTAHSPPLRVLVVDDCPDTTASMALLLRCWGHDVCIAHDGPSAVDLAEAYHPEVVLLDLGLPGMDGYEVARRLRGQLGLTDARILSLSGFAQERDRRRAREAGCDAHLVKPVDLDFLQRLLESSRAPARQA